jgi:DNA replication protein DnaC
MERLNEIFGRTTLNKPGRHPHATGEGAQDMPAHHEAMQPASRQEQGAYGGQPSPTPLPLTRQRRMQEQMARLGQKHLNGQYPQQTQHAQISPAGLPASTTTNTHVHHGQRSEGARERSYPALTPPIPPGMPTRQPYPHQQSGGAAQVRKQVGYEESTRRVPGTRPMAAPDAYDDVQRVYQTEEYAPPLQADVLSEFDADDEPGGIRYGDWESDNEAPMAYQRAHVEIIPGSPGSYVALRSSSVPAAPATNPPLIQESRQPRRMTQPLRPRSDTGVHHEQIAAATAGQAAAIEAAPTVTSVTTTRPTRQLAPRDALSPAVKPPGSVRGLCPLCKGAGYLRADVPFGDPRFGKPIPCDCKQAEKRERRRQQLLELSDISAFRSRSFINFNTRIPGIHPSVQEAFQAAYNFAQNPNGWLVLVGPNGCGKTHLAAAIANHCLNEGEVVLFSVVPELLDHLRAAFAPSSVEVYDQLFAKMREAGLLILDDLGAHYSTPWATEKLFQLLNYRYNWRMPTVITSNMSGLQSIDIRLRSRMTDSSLVVTVNLERARDCRPYLIRQDQPTRRQE